MVEAGDDRRDRIPQGDKVDHHAVRLGRALDIDAHGPVVAVDRFAEVSVSVMKWPAEKTWTALRSRTW